MSLNNSLQQVPFYRWSQRKIRWDNTLRRNTLVRRDCEQLPTLQPVSLLSNRQDLVRRWDGMNAWKEWDERSLLSYYQRGLIYIITTTYNIYIIIIKVLIGNPSFIRLVYVLRTSYFVGSTLYIVRSTFSGLHSVISLPTYLGHLLFHPSSFILHLGEVQGDWEKIGYKLWK